MSISADSWSDVFTKVKEGLSHYDPVPVFEELFRFLYEGSIVIDTKGHVVFMDKPTETWFGLPPGAGRGRNLAEFFPDLGLLKSKRTYFRNGRLSKKYVWQKWLCYKGFR